MNRIFYIMGKSSSGKDTVYKNLLSQFGFTPLTLYTTRPVRENEQNGREYFFVDRAYFDKMKSDGKIIEERIYNTVYGEWIYFTGADSVDLDKGNFLGIGTLESYLKLRDYFGNDAVIPIYIEVDDDIRLIRAIERERIEEKPKYTELCRRFIADSEDFSEEKLLAASINKRFSNNTELEHCIDEIKTHINSIINGG